MTSAGDLRRGRHADGVGEDRGAGAERSRRRAAAATTSATGTSCSKGQPKAVARVTSTTAPPASGQRHHVGSSVGSGVGGGQPGVVAAVGVADGHDVLQVGEPGGQGPLRAQWR